MFAAFRTIRAKLLFTFFLFLLITAFVVLANIFWFDAREAQMQKIYDTLDAVIISTQTAKRLEYVFIHEDVIKESFYQTKTSESLEKRIKQIEKTKKDLNYLKNVPDLRFSAITKDIDLLIAKVDSYEINFKKLVELTQERGFKNYGIEGKMRDAIHDLENANMNPIKVLTLRRHEKDFIIRKQPEYLTKHAEVSNLLRNEIAANTQMLNLLNQYEQDFKQLADLEQKIGFSNKDGIKAELTKIGLEIDKTLAILTQDLRKTGDAVRQQNSLIQYIIIAICIVLIVFIAFYITQILSNPISKLSDTIHEVIESNFSKEVKFTKLESKDEIGELAEDVEIMVAKVQDSIAEIQEQSAKVERKQKILMDGVNYGKRIQNAILPDFELTQYFRNYFVLYSPLYDVSGDFYWFTELNGKCFLAVVDCTGHGVAGGFMSMIGNSLLNELVNEKQLEDPSFILETLNTQVRIALRQEKQRNEDSMDVCLCCVEEIPEKENYRKITFAGANRPIFYSNGWDMHEIKGTSRSIGGREFDKNVSFENHTFELKKGNFLYLSSDGFVNQTDKEKKKYGTTRFIEFMRKTSHLPMVEQEKKLQEELARHMDDTIQRDDITVFALKL